MAVSASAADLPSSGGAGALARVGASNGGGAGEEVIAEEGQEVKMQMRAPRAGKYDLVLYCISGNAPSLLPRVPARCLRISRHHVCALAGSILFSTHVILSRRIVIIPVCHLGYPVSKYGTTNQAVERRSLGAVRCLSAPSVCRAQTAGWAATARCR